MATTIANSQLHIFAPYYQKSSILFADSKSSSIFALYKLFNT